MILLWSKYKDTGRVTKTPKMVICRWWEYTHFVLYLYFPKFYNYKKCFWNKADMLKKSAMDLAIFIYQLAKHYSSTGFVDISKDYDS